MSHDIFLTIALIYTAICVIVCISNFSFCNSIKILRAPTTNLTNDFCRVSK